MVYIGVDVGGTGIKAGLVSETGEILYKTAIPTRRERPFEDVVADIGALCDRLVERAGAQGVAAVGVGIPGICDPVTGIVPNCANLGWFNVPFIAEMKKHIRLPLYVNNDATVAGLAESVSGVSAGASSSVFITLGTGVGGGIVFNGRPYSGAHGIGSEIGHMILDLGGEPCTCGNRGCFERYASATAVIREARKAVAAHPESAILRRCGGDPARINAKTVFDSAKEGDETALSVFRGYVNALSHGIIGIINLIDPEIIVLGGGVSLAGDFLLDAVREQVSGMQLFKGMPYARIELAQLSADAGIIGAAMLGRQ